MNVLISPWNHIYPYVLLECLHKSFFIFGIKLKNISKMNIKTKKQIKHYLLRPRFSKFHVFDNNNDFYLSVGRMVFRSALINVFFLHNYNLKIVLTVNQEWLRVDNHLTPSTKYINNSGKL